MNKIKQYTKDRELEFNQTIKGLIDVITKEIDDKKINSGVGSNCDDNYDKAISDITNLLKNLIK